jgi:hypothetical protein
MVEDSLEILNMAINRWKAITGHLFDSSRPNSLTRVDDIVAKEYEELKYQKLRLKEPKNFIDFSVKILSKAFKHDVYSSQSISSELADMSTSVSDNSISMGLMSELYRFLACGTLLSETVTNLEAGRN